MKKRVPDIRRLARRQRWLLFLVLMAFVSQAFMYIPSPVSGDASVLLDAAVQVLWLVIEVLMFVGIVLILRARGSNIFVIVLYVFLMLAPCFNLLLLLAINIGVNRTLRRAGLKVGLLGVNPDELERVLNAALCVGCGYNLTGNVSGLCPECGRPIDRPIASDASGGLRAVP